jgi:integrase
MSKVLTDAAVKNLKADPDKRREIPDARQKGLHLVIQPSGRKSWAVRYRYRGKPKKLTLDGFPSLDVARRLAQDAIDVLAKGGDPAEAKKEAKAKESDESLLFKNVVADFIEKYHRHDKKNRYADWVETLFKNHVTPTWGEKHIAEINAGDVEKLIEKIDGDGKHVLANRVFTALKTFFGWCVKRRSIPIAVSPCDGLERTYEEMARERVMTDDEIRWFWKAATEHGQPFGHMFKILLLSGQRRTEVAGMSNKEMDGTDWTIPGARTKNAQDHIVPISIAVRDVLDDVKRIQGRAGFIFTTTGETFATGWSRATKAIAKRMVELAREETGDPAFEIERWTLHDLRRTCASGMAKLRIRPHVIEAVLNHKSGVIRGIAAIYNRYDYFEEKQSALDAWGNYVTSLVEGKPDSNVVPLSAAR